MTAVGLILAAYQILPRSRRLDLSLRFGTFAWALTGTTLTVVLYLQLFPIAVSFGLTPHLGLFRYGLSPERASFVVAMLASVILALHLWKRRLPPRAMQKFSDLVEELLWSRQYPSLIALLDTHLHRVVAIADCRHLLGRLRPRDTVEIRLQPDEIDRLVLVAQEAGYVPITPAPRFKRLATSIRHLCKAAWLKATRWLPDPTGKSAIADSTLAYLLSNKSFAEGVILSRPYFALEILGLGRQEVHDFFQAYMARLFLEPTSCLYGELRRTHNVADHYRYVIPESNRLLSYLFSDARTAETLSAWAPIGEAMIEELDRLARVPREDPYNRPADREFLDRGRYELPLAAGLHYFDVMVTSALYQGIEWHMWLYYFPYFSQRIARNYMASDPLVDPDAEWPIRYSYLAYQIISNLKGWITSIGNLAATSPHRRLKSISTEHENDNIPKSSILAMGQCLWIFVNAEQIPDRFKTYLIDSVFDGYFRLREHCRRDDYASVLALAIRKGGPWQQKDGGRYRNHVRSAYEAFDKIPHSHTHVLEFEQQLFE